jgi:hypothetical protein
MGEGIIKTKHNTKQPNIPQQNTAKQNKKKKFYVGAACR